MTSISGCKSRKYFFEKIKKPIDKPVKAWYISIIKGRGNRPTRKDIEP